jgi:ABC-type Fe3+/spermidine/putrescine transport system ATPase subunit
MGDLRLDGVSKRFGAKTAVDDLTIEVRDGEFFAILGPSGCGKTTALRRVAGFVEPDRGRILFGKREVTGLAPERRDAAMVFQNYALFPHLDVGENVAFGLRARRLDPARIRERVTRALALVELDGYERRDVGELSGGEQQRVALARAIVVEPSILLLDEPMSNLDPVLREGTRRDLRELQRRLGITTLYVTHDQQEALEMADRVAVIEHGRLVQVGTPRELYDRPATEFAATFVGRANLLAATVRATGAGEAVLELLGGRTVRARGDGLRCGESVRVAVRPESLLLDEQGEGLERIAEGDVRAVVFQGPTLELTVAVEGGGELRVLVLNRGAAPQAPGRRVRLAAPRDRLVVLGS